MTKKLDVKAIRKQRAIDAHNRCAERLANEMDTLNEEILKSESDLGKLRDRMEKLERLADKATLREEDLNDLGMFLPTPAPASRHLG